MTWCGEVKKGQDYTQILGRTDVWPSNYMSRKAGKSLIGITLCVPEEVATSLK